MLQIPTFGSDPLTLGICLDKSRAKEILAHNRIPTAPFVVVHSMDALQEARVRFPSIVKPLHEGSSKGYTILAWSDRRTTRARGAYGLQVYREPALIESSSPGGSSPSR